MLFLIFHLRLAQYNNEEHEEFRNGRILKRKKKNATIGQSGSKYKLLTQKLLAKMNLNFLEFNKKNNNNGVSDNFVQAS